MKTIDATANGLVGSLLALPPGRGVSILDSCGVGHLGSHLLIAGIDPVASFSLAGESASRSLGEFQRLLEKELAAIFTISYDFGRKFENGSSESLPAVVEPDICISLFDSLMVHDYDAGETVLIGNQSKFDSKILNSKLRIEELEGGTYIVDRTVNFGRDEYIEAVEKIKEHIRNGDTYQTNLTQKFRIALSDDVSPQSVFWRLRRDNPAPFAAYLDRDDSSVISSSPERFFRVSNRKIAASPIKGTRPRSSNPRVDAQLRNELLNSAKDRAENIMIVDLVRNDLGRVCEFGSVGVVNLCELEEHPTLFHLVSTVEGTLRTGVKFADIVRALFPCGSITGAPKIRTMEIIDQLERSPRGLSMGAIGYYIPPAGFEGLTPGFDLSVAIRTMVIRYGITEFNVGGGITIDSDPTAEYEEALLKAKALLSALGNK